MQLGKLLIAIMLTTTLLLAVPGSASAHAHQDVLDGKYEIVLGWRTEPAYAGVTNGLDLRVNKYVDGGDHHDGDHAHDDGHGHVEREKTPVSGLVGNLTVTYEIAGESFSPLEFRARHGVPGGYTGEITPTREGEYTVHIVGDIEGQPIDVRMKPEAIRSYQPTMFPEDDLTPEQTAAKIADLEAEVASLKAELAAMKTDAQSDPAPTVVGGGNGIPGIGVVLAALGAVGAALILRGRK